MDIINYIQIAVFIAIMVVVIHFFFVKPRRKRYDRLQQIDEVGELLGEKRSALVKSSCQAWQDQDIPLYDKLKAELVIVDDEYQDKVLKPLSEVANECKQ